MKVSDLDGEMIAAASAIKSAHFKKLEAIGVPPMAIGRYGASGFSIGVSRIGEVGGGLFEPDAQGFPACLIAVRDPFPHFGESGLFDIVAFCTDNLSVWWCRTGLASLMGADLLDKPDPVPVVRTPADWLAHSGNALCVLDWSPNSPAWAELRFATPPLTFTDSDLRKRLRNALVQSSPLPRMEIAA
ncbi:hypothetical protein [Pontixanthobacter sp. CEM42]|uniref:hypothetical protein n=1 Tax=Pontixanthobacter sp. CEM42 TaxID=2792077 RepID=UPI001AE03687|nr:hypothetical protein [Pontixanthobacter sp. CEM42]